MTLLHLVYTLEPSPEYKSGGILYDTAGQYMLINIM